MKDSLANLPQRKRGELVRIVSIIRESTPQAEMIILFGSYARGDAVEDVTVDGNTTYEYSSDFDILVIVKSKSLADNLDLWYSIEDEAGKLPVQTPVKIIAHEIEFVKRQTPKGPVLLQRYQKRRDYPLQLKKLQTCPAKRTDPAGKTRTGKSRFQTMVQWCKRVSY